DVHRWLPAQAVGRGWRNPASKNIGIEGVNPRNSKSSPLHLPQAANSLPWDREKAEKRSFDGRREACFVRFNSPKILPEIYEQPRQSSPLRALVVVRHLLLDDEPVKLRETSAIERPISVGAVKKLNVE
ncbi:hypothetical protein, partial [Mesorhizobium sp. M2A.F.Ca.ET.039.01.1.1]|uniref:hypothetical protein n=1 Tax=Mesorhizobium sp. M2A.F.Ca.ET.039.01.1.1 TaxID=2496746 RepID=UPI001AECB2BF